MTDSRIHRRWCWWEGIADVHRRLMSGGLDRHTDRAVVRGLTRSMVVWRITGRERRSAARYERHAWKGTLSR